MQGGLTALEAPPILLFDGAKGLILKNVDSWGKEDGDLLQHLGFLNAVHGLDFQTVRVALTGIALPQAFLSTNPGTRFNWHYHRTADPAVDATLTALTGLGYTEGEAGRMIALAGTRVGLFGAVMATGGATAEAAVERKKCASPPVSEG